MQVINGTGHGAEVDWWALGILTHELLYGVTPFRGQRRDETFENVLRVPLNLPTKPTVSPECRDFISQLLVRPPPPPRPSSSPPLPRPPLLFKRS